MEHPFKYCRLLFLIQILRYVAICDCALKIDFVWTESTTNGIEGINLQDNAFGLTDTNPRTKQCVYVTSESNFFCFKENDNDKQVDNLGSVFFYKLNSNKFTFEKHRLTNSTIPEDAVRYYQMPNSKTYVAPGSIHDKTIFNTHLQTFEKLRKGKYVWGAHNDSIYVLVFKVKGVVLLRGRKTGMDCSGMKSLPRYNLTRTEYRFRKVLDGEHDTCFSFNHTDEFRFDLAIPEEWRSVENIEIAMEGQNPRCEEPMFLAYTVRKNNRTTAIQCNVTELTRNGDMVECSISCDCHDQCYMLFLHVLNQHWSPSKITKVCEIRTKNAREIPENEPTTHEQSSNKTTDEHSSTAANGEIQYSGK